MGARIWPGKPYPLGATWDGAGVNFAPFSEHATGVELCLFGAEGPRRESARVAVKERTDRVRHAYRPDAIAEVLLAHRISALPVVDASGAIVGIVSEGDLMRRAETGSERHRSWWLRLVSSTDERARDDVKTHGRHAADVMTRDVITVTEDSPVCTIARLLEERRIKRVPVARGSRLVGIVSRADVVRGLATQPAPLEASPSTDDRAIRDRLMSTLGGAGWTRPEFVKVIVTGGVVHLWGLVASEEERRALRIAAGNVPGVRGVEDHMGSMPPTLWAE